MNCLKSQGPSVNSVILKHLQQLLKICSLAQTLQKRTQTLLTTTSRSQKTILHRKEKELSFSNEENDQGQHREMGFLQLLYDKILTSKADFVYYQRVSRIQNYDRAVQLLQKDIESVIANSKHQFYRSRKTQVHLIMQVVGLIDQMENKLIRCLKDVKIQFPTEFTNYIKSTIAKTKMIQYKPKSKSISKYIIKVKIQQEQNKKSDLITPVQKEKEDDKIVVKQQARQTVTNATTRPSSFGKQTNSRVKFHISIPNSYTNSKTNLNYNYNLSSRIKHTRKSHNRQRSHEKSKNQSQRPKTAKIGFDYFYFPKNLEKRGTQKQIFTSQLEIEEKPKQKVQEMPISTYQIKVAQKQIDKKLKNQQKFEKLIKNESKKQKRRRYGIKQNNYTNGINTVKAEISNISGENTLEEKDDLMSSTLRSYAKMHQGRFFQSHPNLLGLYQFKTNKRGAKFQRGQVKRVRLSKKKLTKNSHVLQAQKNCEEEGYSKGQHKNVVLLIKPSEQTLKQSKSGFYTIQKQNEAKLNESYNQHQKQKQKAAMSAKSKVEIQLKRIRQQDDFFVNKQLQINNYVKIQDLKLDLQEINKIRQQFLKCRKQNNYISLSQNVQHSSFFIEQDFLSHRQNIRFQAHLKQLKEQQNKENQFEPFNIETEIEQFNNKKLKEIEREENFRGEGMWIKNRFYQSELLCQFGELGQFGLDRVRNFVI